MQFYVKIFKFSAIIDIFIFSILHCVFFFHAFLSFVSLSFLAFFWIGFYFPHSFFSNTLKVIFNFHYVIKCNTLFNVLIFYIVFYNSTMMILSVHFLKSYLEFFWLLDSGLGSFVIYRKQFCIVFSKYCLFLHLYSLSRIMIEYMIHLLGLSSVSFRALVYIFHLSASLGYSSGKFFYLPYP